MWLVTYELLLLSMYKVNNNKDVYCVGVGHGAAAQAEAPGGPVEVPAQAQALAHRRRVRPAQRLVDHL
jgi:hypothetical protein